MEDKQGSRVVRIKGVPKATPSDVQDFFSGIDINECCIHLDFKERRGTGEALILFNSAEDAQRALAKDKEFFSPKFGQRYVRVLPADDLTVEETRHVNRMVATQYGSTRLGLPTAKMHSHGVVKVEGLPQSITLPELHHLFWGAQICASSTVIQRSSGQQQTSAHAFMDFGSPDGAAHAVSNWHGTVVTTAAGTSTLTVKHASRKELDDAKTASRKEDAVLKVRGLPIRATVADVISFFDGYKLKAGGVHLQPISENRHSKIAYVEFESVDEALKALEKDHQLFGKAFGDRYCLLQRVQREEMESDLVRFAVKAASHSGRTTTSSAATNLDFPSMSGGSASSFLHQRLPGFSAAMPPGFMFPGMFGAQPPMPPMGMGMMPPWAAMGANMGMGMMPGVPGGPPVPPMQMPMPMPPFNPAPSTARYMVQDLTTGQKVFLDPRFNVYPGGQGPPMGPFPGSGPPTAAATAAPTTTEPRSSTLPANGNSDGCDQNHIGGASAGKGVERGGDGGGGGGGGLHRGGSSKASEHTETDAGSGGEGEGGGSGGGSGNEGDGSGSDGARRGKGGSGAASNQGSDGSGSGNATKTTTAGGRLGVGDGCEPPSTNGNQTSAANMHTNGREKSHANVHGGVTSALRDVFKEPPHKRISLEVDDLPENDRPPKLAHTTHAVGR